MKTAQFDHCPVGDSCGENRRISCPASLQNKLLWRLAISALVVCSYLPAHGQENEWTWVSGSNTANQWVTIGNDGRPLPGPREGAAGWTDTKENLWLFGGSSYDLWEYSPANGQWTWVGGNYLPNGCSGTPTCVGGYTGVYGSQGVAAPNNWPAERFGAVNWADQNGNLWLFGGDGFALAGNPVGSQPVESQQGLLNDLWEFNPSTLEWTWVSGTGGGFEDCKYVGPPLAPVYECWNMPNYGQLGVSAAANTPGSRTEAAGWTDKDGSLWLFGGGGYDSLGNYGYLNDLWKFDVSTGQWTWMGGSNTEGQLGVYGTQGSPSAGNVPGGRAASANWTDSSGSLWLFGGSGIDSKGNTDGLNDLWKYDTTNQHWTWVGGSAITDQSGSYGTEGIAASGNAPGWRYQSAAWSDQEGNLWLFGGTGADAEGNEGSLNDLWEFNILTNAWTWMGGSSVMTNGQSFGLVPLLGQPGIYGALGVADPENQPGGREDATTFADARGSFWLFGGSGFDVQGFKGLLNDLWEYQPSGPTPVTPTPMFSVAGGTYTSTQTVAISDSAPGAMIYYTTDGSAPTSASTSYSGALTVSTSETINAIAVLSGYPASAAVSAAYEIKPPPPSFSFGALPTSLTMKYGGTGTTTLTVTPQNGFNSAVSFVCSGLPTGALCGFSPATVTPSGGAVNTTLKITAPATAAAMRPNSRPGLPIAAVLTAVCLLGWKRRRNLQLWLLLAVVAGGAGLISCGGGGGNGGGGSGGSAPLTATVTVTATSGTLQQTATISLTAN